MSAPNVNNPNEGIVGQAVNSATNAANYVKETVLGTSAEAQKEGGKEQMKGNVGSGSIGDRISGAGDAISGGADQAKHESSASANKNAI